MNTHNQCKLEGANRLYGHWITEKGDAHFFVSENTIVILTSRRFLEASWEVLEDNKSGKNMSLSVHYTHETTHTWNVDFAKNHLSIAGEPILGRSTLNLVYLGPEQIPQGAKPVKCANCGKINDGTCIYCECGSSLFRRANQNLGQIPTSISIAFALAIALLWQTGHEELVWGAIVLGGAILGIICGAGKWKHRK